MTGRYNLRSIEAVRQNLLNKDTEESCDFPSDDEENYEEEDSNDSCSEQNASDGEDEALSTSDTYLIKVNLNLS